MTTTLEVTDADREAANDMMTNADCRTLDRYEQHVRYAFAAHRTLAHAEGYEAAVRDVVEKVLRPISGIENRTAQEVFDMMCARIEREFKT